MRLTVAALAGGFHRFLLVGESTPQKQDVELSFAFSAAGAGFVLLAVGLALWWNRLP